MRRRWFHCPAGGWLSCQASYWAAPPSRLAAASTPTTVCSHSATATSPLVQTEANGGGDSADTGGDPIGGDDPNGGGDLDRGVDGGGDGDGGGDSDGGGDLDGDPSAEGGRRDVGPVDWTGLGRGATGAQARRRLLPPPPPTARLLPW
jgi:hypothetical protein